jgi:acyl carrier protein
VGLDTVEFILWAEQEFEIEIPDSDTAHILTVGQFTSYVLGKLQDAQGSASMTEAAVFDRIRTFLVTNFHVPADKISRDSQFITDLKLDR